jgi:predicted HTH domain antitoxin
MAVTFSLPDGVEGDLRKECGDLDRVAKEALAIELYRSGRISVGFLAEMLGLGVLEADAWLAARGVPLNYSDKDLENDLCTLDRLLADRPQ